MRKYLNAILISFFLYSAIYLGVNAFLLQGQIALLFIGMSIVTGIFAKKVGDFLSK